MHAHRLRHTYATQLLNTGCPMTSIQKLLGHKKLNTTMMYARAYDQTVEADYFAAMNRVEQRLQVGLEPETTAAPVTQDEKAQLPGPLSALLDEAVSHARQTGRPLFSRKPVTGALVEVFSQAGLPALRAFAMQLDEVAGKGVDSGALMNDAARALAREYHDRVMMEKEKLGGRLTTLVAFHFFFPAVLLILMAFLLPMIQLFQ